MSLVCALCNRHHWFSVNHHGAMTFPRNASWVFASCLPWGDVFFCGSIKDRTAEPRSHSQDGLPQAGCNRPQSASDVRFEVCLLYPPLVWEKCLLSCVFSLRPLNATGCSKCAHVQTATWLQMTMVWFDGDYERRWFPLLSIDGRIRDPLS